MRNHWGSNTLYELVADLSHAHQNLDPVFLRDFLMLPQDLFTLNAAKTYQAFIDKYRKNCLECCASSGSHRILECSRSVSYTHLTLPTIYSV